MSPTKHRQVDSDDPTVRNLQAALATADDDTVRFHIRQALQHQLIARERNGDA